MSSTSRDAVLRLMRSVAAGEATPEEALRRLAWLPSEPVRANGAGESDAGGAGLGMGAGELGPAGGGGGEGEGGAGAGGDDGGDTFARLDHHRALRNGFPEAVFCQGKTPEQVVAICERLAARDGGFLATRADAPVRDALASAFPDAELHTLARVVHLPTPAAAEAAARGDGARQGTLLVACAGTADLPVAQEAAVTGRAFGNTVETLSDVGVAGLHRLLGAADTLERAAVIIVVAGMEGALPSVLGGLVRVPVIAVPTSVGYGAAFGGIAALLGMLNSCAAGVTVVNIDNGFGAACAATRILQPAVG